MHCVNYKLSKNVLEHCTTDMKPCETFKKYQILVAVLTNLFIADEY